MKEETICVYCQKVITSIQDINNADDWSDDFNKKYPYGAKCCSRCHDIIVLPNRLKKLKAY